MKVLQPIDRLPTPPIELVLCSSGARWNAAVRAALSRKHNRWPQVIIRLHEVDELGQLDQVSYETPCGLVGLEIGEENLPVCVDWLAARRRPSVPVVGLLTTPPFPVDVYAQEHQRRRVETLATLVHEAGAVWTIASPLKARELVDVAVQHGLSFAQTPPTVHQLDRAIWQTLPWQSSRRPLRLTGEA